MRECDRDKYVSVVFKYQQEIPLKNECLRRHYSIEQIANLPDDVLSKYYHVISERLKIIKKIKEEYLAKKTPVDSEIDDEMQQYLVDTYEIDNGLDEEPILYKENLLGAVEPNQVEKILSRIKYGNR